MEISVRAARVEDAPEIAVVNLASWETAYRGVVLDEFLDGATPEGRTARWTEILTAGGRVLVAESEQGEIVGYCGLSLPARDNDLGSEVAEVAAIYVSPSIFRSGAGSALMRRALAVAIEAEYCQMILWVLRRNMAAQGFYAGHGFAADGAAKWLDALGAEEIRLRRQLRVRR